MWITLGWFHLTLLCPSFAVDGCGKIVEMRSIELIGFSFDIDFDKFPIGFGIANQWRWFLNKR